MARGVDDRGSLLAAGGAAEVKEADSEREESEARSVGAEVVLEEAAADSEDGVHRVYKDTLCSPGIPAFGYGRS